MAKPYSNDLRRKVIDAIELDGMKRSEASETFRISRNTINLWFQRKAQKGISSRSNVTVVGTVIKSKTGKSFAHGSSSMPIKLRKAVAGKRLN